MIYIHIYQLHIHTSIKYITGERAKDIKRDVDVIADHRQLQALAKSLVDKINSRFGTTIVAELRPPEYLKLDPRLDITSFGIKDSTKFIDDGRYAIYR